MAGRSESYFGCRLQKYSASSGPVGTQKRLRSNHQYTGIPGHQSGCKLLSSGLGLRVKGQRLPQAVQAEGMGCCLALLSCSAQPPSSSAHARQVLGSLLTASLHKACSVLLGRRAPSLCKAAPELVLEMLTGQGTPACMLIRNRQRPGYAYVQLFMSFICLAS